MTKKPHIYRANGWWVCLGAHNGWCGTSPSDAYAKWRMAEKTWATFKEQPK